MEYAIWNGQIYSALEIADSYELEKSIKKASGRKELKCIDPECGSPTLRYCHGEKKCAYFAHLDSCSCDYAEFDKENTQLMRQVKHTLYESFLSRGFNVRIDVKLLTRHYTHLLFTMSNGKKIAVELGTQRTTANRIDYLTEQYRNIGVNVKWIVVSKDQTLAKENETFFMKRYLLNENKKNDILIHNCTGNEITQYIVDPNQYLFEGKTVRSENYPDIYSEMSSIDNLVFEDDELSIKGFHLRYNEWLIKKRKAFDKKIIQIKEARAQEKQRKTLSENSYKNGFNRVSMKPIYSNEINTREPANEKTSVMSYEDRRKSILPLLEQQTEQVIDSIGDRWIRCELCGAVETSDKFWSFGGANHVNLGSCNECRKKTQ